MATRMVAPPVQPPRSCSWPPAWPPLLPRLWVLRPSLTEPSIFSTSGPLLGFTSVPLSLQCICLVKDHSGGTCQHPSHLPALLRGPISPQNRQKAKAAAPPPLLAGAQGCPSSGPTLPHSAGHPPSGVPWMGGPAVTPAPRAPGGEPARAAVVDLVSLSGPSGGAGKRQSSA